MEETWVRGQFSFYRGWYGRLMNSTYPVPTETPRLRQRGETKTYKQRTKSEYSAGFAVGT